jgi:hypothetical protein
MPKGDALSDEELLRANDWINEKAVSPTDACPVCGSPKNSVFPALTQVRVADVPSPGLLPMVMTICRNCGFVRFFSAVVMGLMEGNWPNKDSLRAEEAEGDDASTAT